MQTPLRSTLPRPTPSAPVKRQVKYSSAPLCTIDENALSSSRFVNPTARQLPFRDSSGAINVHLCERSLSACDARLDGDAERATLAAWARHAKRAIAARPKEEHMTLDDLVEEEDLQEREREARPISLRKPRRSGTTSLVPTPPESTARETIVVIPPPPRGAHAVALQDDDDDDDKVAAGTVAMQRRLFRAPQPGDEPLHDEYDEPRADLLYLRRLTEGKPTKRRRRSPTPTSDDDVYEVAAILKESEGRFLIRWQGYGPEDDTWEPQDHIAPALVQAYRERHQRSSSHAGEDYGSGRTTLLWCSSCKEHRSADNFSAQQRRAEPAHRACLHHHYRTGALATTPVTNMHARTPAHPAKRPRTEMPHTTAPAAPKRPVAPSLSARHADLEVAKCRLYGFSMC